MQQAPETHGHGHGQDTIILPAPTVWPIVLALGLTLVITGMVTHWVISLLGLVLTLRAMIGWFFDMFPHEKHVAVPIEPYEVTIASTRTIREQVEVGRKLLPIETFSVVAGVKGGIVGGIAMIVPATLFSLLRYHSIWYSANLLAAGGFVSWREQSNEF